MLSQLIKNKFIEILTLNIPSSKDNKHITFLEQHITKIGIFSLSNFLFFFLLKYFNFASANLGDLLFQRKLHLLVIAGSLILIFWHKLVVTSKQLVKMFCLYTILWYLFCFYNSYMLFISQGAVEWHIHYLVLNLILIIILDNLVAISIICSTYLLILVYFKTEYFFDISKSTHIVLYYTVFMSGLIGCLKYYLRLLLIEENKILEENNKKLLENASLKTAYAIHEIRNPLHGIMGITKILYQNKNLDKPQYVKHIKNIYKELNKLSIFTNNLFESSKLESKKQSLVTIELNLLPIIKQTITDIKKFTSKNEINILFKFEDSIALIYGDKVKIHQVINNILDNAIKYSKKGVITVTLSAHVSDSKDYWKITISDQGEGVAESELEYIFEPYARSNNVLKSKIGSGLGLALCKEIISEHQGLIWAENDKQNNNGGAIFIILIPKLAKTRK